MPRRFFHVHTDALVREALGRDGVFRNACATGVHEGQPKSGVHSDIRIRRCSDRRRAISDAGSTFLNVPSGESNLRVMTARLWSVSGFLPVQWVAAGREDRAESPRGRCAYGIFEG